METWLRCSISLGQFSGEFAVTGEQADGSTFSFFAPANQVRIQKRPEKGEAVEGWVRVQLWENGGDKAVVRLPRESFEKGRYVTVRADQLAENPRAQTVP